MTLTELQQINDLRRENQRLKEENERLRQRFNSVLYANQQAHYALSLTKVLVGAAL